MNFEKQMLVSLPPLTDNNFQKSVVYLQEHDGDGASGWIINKELENRISVRLRKGIQLAVNAPIFYGGPVDINSAYVLHSGDLRLNSSQEIEDNLYVTRDKQMIDMLNSKNFPGRFRIIIGRCSWVAGQLESEVVGSRTNGKMLWTNCPYTNQYFWSNPNDQWEQGIQNSAVQRTTDYLNF